jgi:hypothetical protein
MAVGAMNFAEGSTRSRFEGNEGKNRPDESCLEKTTPPEHVASLRLE